MGDTSILLIICINLAALLFVVLIAFAWVLLKKTPKQKSIHDEKESSLSKAKIEDDQDTEQNMKLGGEIEFLKKQNVTQQERIKNLEKFKTLYFKTNDTVQAETERVRLLLMNIIKMSKEQDTGADILLETEHIFHSLKKLHPLLEGVSPELFETEDYQKNVETSSSSHDEEEYSKQLSIIETLQQELAKSQESVEKLQYLKRLAKASSDQNSKLKIELLKAQSLAKNSRENQIKVKSLQAQLDSLMKKERRDSDEKISLNRQIANMSDETVAPTDPKDMEVGTYINSLVSDIAQKNTELEQSKIEFNKMEEEYNRLFYKLQDANESKDSSPENLKSIRNELREAEIKMNESGIQVKLAEGEVITLSNNCDELISMQQKYNNLQKEYEMLAEAVNDKVFSDENQHLQAKVKSLTLENEQLKELDQKLSETVYELDRARVEYSMLEQEYVKLAEESQ